MELLFPGPRILPEDYTRSLHNIARFLALSSRFISYVSDFQIYAKCNRVSLECQKCQPPPPPKSCVFILAFFQYVTRTRTGFMRVVRILYVGIGRRGLYISVCFISCDFFLEVVEIRRKKYVLVFVRLFRTLTSYNLRCMSTNNLLYYNNLDWTVCMVI